MGRISSIWHWMFPPVSTIYTTTNPDRVRLRHRRNGKWVHTWYPTGNSCIDADDNLFVQCVYCHLGPAVYKIVNAGGLGECLPDKGKISEGSQSGGHLGSPQAGP
jgi:hypothetical protein